MRSIYPIDIKGSIQLWLVDQISEANINNIQKFYIKIVNKKLICLVQINSYNFLFTKKLVLVKVLDTGGVHVGVCKKIQSKKMYHEKIQ